MKSSSHFPIIRLFALAACLLAMATIVPAAGVDGTWNMVFVTEVGDRPMQITLKSDGDTVSGPIMDQVMKGTFKDGKLILQLTDFYSPDAGFKANLSIEGLVKDGKLEGTWKFAEYSGPVKGTLGGATAAAKVDGTWNLVLITEIGDKPAQVVLSSDGETVKGTFGEAAIAGTYRDGNLVLAKRSAFVSSECSVAEVSG